MTSMVLFDMNKKEAKEMATKNLLEYKSTTADNNSTSDKTAEAASEDGTASGSGDVSVRKMRQGNQTVTEVISGCSRDKLLAVIAAPEAKKAKLD